MPTANPTLQPKFFLQEAMTSSPGNVMTIRGTAMKGIILTAILAAVAGFTWTEVFPHGMVPEANGSVVIHQKPMMIALIGGCIGGLITSLIICFVPKSSPFLAPVYAACEGALLGAISGLYTVQAYPGIVPQAIMMTLGTLAIMLLCWWTGIIKMSDKLRSGIIGATMAIAAVYLVAFVLSLFGVNMSFLWGNSLLSIGISIFIVIVAAANLLIDFETIENGARTGAPKYMEWFAAYGLMVTLVWLYLEILRLLAKVAGRNSDR